MIEQADFIDRRVSLKANYNYLRNNMPAASDVMFHNGQLYDILVGIAMLLKDMDKRIQELENDCTS